MLTQRGAVGDRDGESGMDSDGAASLRQSLLNWHPQYACLQLTRSHWACAPNLKKTAPEEVLPLVEINVNHCLSQMEAERHRRGSGNEHDWLIKT